MKRLISRMVLALVIVGLQYVLLQGFFADMLPTTQAWIIYYSCVVLITYVLDGMEWLWKKLTP